MSDMRKRSIKYSIVPLRLFPLSTMNHFVSSETFTLLINLAGAAFYFSDISSHGMVRFLCYYSPSLNYIPTSMFITLYPFPVCSIQSK